MNRPYVFYAMTCISTVEHVLSHCANVINVRQKCIQAVFENIVYEYLHGKVIAFLKEIHVSHQT